MPTVIRTPAPTYQREWERRIVRLSQAGIPTVLLLGNHDISPAVGRAHTLQEFDTLNVANVHVIAKPRLLKPDNLNGVRLQVAAIPWVYRSGLVAREGIESTEANETIENRIGEIADEMIEQSDPDIPLVLLAHGSVAGASLGYERTIMLGADFILPGRIVRNPRFAYVALGHIHKAQDLNEGSIRLWFIQVPSSGWTLARHRTRKVLSLPPLTTITKPHMKGARSTAEASSTAMSKLPQRNTLWSKPWLPCPHPKR